jgi:hypothetical protein
MSERLSYDRTVQLLREVIGEFGEDHTYPIYPMERLSDGRQLRCFYVRNDQPSCIVGHVLHCAGMPLEDLRKVEGYGPTDTLAPVQFARWADPEALDLLAEVQVQQDEGATWGEALRDALDGEFDDE